MMRKKYKQKGFTLIEIMVVVVIIGLLATLILPRVLGRQEEAMVAKASSDIRALSSALKLYKLDNFKFPGTSDGLDSLVSGAKDGKGYIDRLPADPWGNDYQYLYPGEKQEFDLWSYGSDGQLGGDDVNADIGNWNLDKRQ
jgi:general secretion pathway protein G